eukprot:TRINITY_DN7984_c0_g1_i2.p1 TRINITY_DN7984_c0_g1~~TRINITY_DN7984_c0_g1_i2.p1  ORF type:complete len:324 (+),score=86.69 TRINITY_DN7984_c0_g1_i2:538-1509(+)
MTTLIEIESGQPDVKQTLQGHQHNVPCIDFNGDGKYIASISIDSTIRTWDVHSGQPINSRILPTREWGWTVRWIPPESIDVVDKSEIEKLFPEFQRHVFGSLLDRALENDEGLYRGEVEYEGEEDGVVEFIGDDEDDFQDEIQDENDFHEDDDDDAMQHPKKSRCITLDSESDSNEFLLCTDFEHGFLFDNKLRCLCASTDIIPGLPQITPLMNAMRRICLSEYIPEMSMALMASTGLGRVAIVHLLKFHQGSEPYAMVTKGHIPFQDEIAPIIGMTISKHVSELNGMTFVRVYILYETKKLFCYEIRRSTSWNPLDFTGTQL